MTPLRARRPAVRCRRTLRSRGRAGRDACCPHPASQHGLGVRRRAGSPGMINKSGHFKSSSNAKRPATVITGGTTSPTAPPASNCSRSTRRSPCAAAPGLPAVFHEPRWTSGQSALPPIHRSGSLRLGFDSTSGSAAHRYAPSERRLLVTAAPQVGTESRIGQATQPIKHDPTERPTGSPTTAGKPRQTGRQRPSAPAPPAPPPSPAGRTAAPRRQRRRSGTSRRCGRMPGRA